LRSSIKLSDRKFILVVVDLTIILVTTLFSLWIHARGLPSLFTFNLAYLIDQSGWLILLAFLWLFSGYINGLYDPIKSSTLNETILGLLRSGTIVMVVYLLVFFYTAPRLILPRGIVVYQVISGFILISIWRIGYIYLSASTRFKRKIIIIGAGWAGKTIAQAILESASNQYQIVGFVDDDPTLHDVEIQVDYQEQSSWRVRNKPEAEISQVQTKKVKVIGKSADLVDLVRQFDVPEVVMAITHDVSSSTFRSLMDCKELAIDITLMTELYESLTGRVPIEHIGDNWFVSLPMDSAETSVFYGFTSRFFDLFSASLGLILLLPFFPLIALAIYVDSPGPIFYKQERVGKGGHQFLLYKLRTMIPDAEADGQAQRALQDDPRVTRVGRWLRKFRLDEMPQLINILKGDMSAVGPRPERPSHLVELDEKVPFHRLRNAVKPGMAGWAVVNFGYIDDLESAKLRLQYDLYYVKHQSIILDLVILFRTFGQIFLLKGR
jgi:exopolysaccharide biosynthesis polyprenyl glycosylphosphotransferase